MIRHSRLMLVAAFAAAALALLPAKNVEAAQINMCQRVAPGAASGPGQWVAPGSNTTYRLNNQGCGLISPTDVADAAAAGLSPRSQIFSAVVTLSAAGTLQLPPGAYIDRIIVQETSGASITGGLKIGTASGGTQVASALLCGTSCLVWVPDASLSTRIFASTAAQTLFIDAVSSWNSARANVTVMYGFW